MELLQLKYFYTIATSKTLTEAARNLHVSQPSLSGMLRKMEKELGGKLFDKTGRYLSLNERGKILLCHAQEILYSLEQLKSEINELNTRADTQLTVELRAASKMILPIIRTFQSTYPHIQINLIQNISSSDNGKLLRETPDLIVSADYTPPAKGVVLLKEELMVAVPKEHPLSEKTSIILEELENEKFIFMSKNKVLREITDYYCKKIKFSPSILLESDDIGMTQDLIRSGAGLSIIPEIAWNSAGLENIKKLHITSYPCIRYIYLQKNEHSMNQMEAELFYQEIQQIFQNT